MDQDTYLSIGVGIAQGLEKATSNLMSIQLAKYKLQQDKEAFEMDKKVKDAQLKQAEFLYGPEAVARISKEHESEMKLKDAQIGYYSEMTKKHEADAVSTLEEANRAAQSFGIFSKMSTKERIMQKVARGETLTSGERQIYNDTIKRGETVRGKSDDTTLLSESDEWWNPPKKEGF
jgi:hypothetical protein